MGRDAAPGGRRLGGGRLARLALLFAFAAAGCAGAAQAPPPRLASVLLAPMHFDPDLPETLEAGAPVVQEVLVEILSEHDLRVDTPALAEFQDTWLAAAKGLGTLYDAKGSLDPARYDEAARRLVVAYRARGADFDALLIPYLAVRQGIVTGHSVEWDGAVHLLPLEHENRDVGHVEARRGLLVTCTSLRLLAYDATGNRLLESYGGLEVALKMKVGDGGWGWIERDDLFENREDLAEGVRAALRPLLRD